MFSFVRTTLPAVFFCAILTIPSPASSSATSGSPHLSRILSCTLTAHIVSAEVSRSPHPCPLCNDSVVLPSWNEHLPPPLSVKILLFPWAVKRRSFHRQHASAQPKVAPRGSVSSQNALSSRHGNCFLYVIVIDKHVLFYLLVIASLKAAVDHLISISCRRPYTPFCS